MRSLRWCVVLLALCTAAHADESKPGPPLSEAARAALEAYGQDDRVRLEALAERDEPDPWITADELLSAGKWEAALAFAKAAPRQDTARLPAYVEARKGREVQGVLRELIRAAAGSVEPSEAAELIEKINALVLQGDPYERVMADVMRANLLSELERFAEASVVYFAAAEAAERLGWFAVAARCFRVSGTLARRDVNVDGMLVAWKRLITVEAGRGNPKGKGTGLMWVGLAHRQLGEYEVALRYMRESEQVFIEIGDGGARAWALTNLGDVLRVQGRYAEAQATLEQALELANQDGHPLRRAHALAGLGILASTLQDLDTAERRYREALEIYQERKDAKRCASCLGNVANVLCQRGRYDEALALFDLAIQTHKRLGARSLHGTGLSAKGYALMMRGRLDEAIELLHEGLELARSIPDEHLQVSLLENLASAYLRKKDYASAHPLIEQSIALATRLGTTKLLVDSYQVQARLWFEQGKHERAFRAAERGMEHARDSMSGLSHARAAFARGRLTKLYKVAIEAAVAWKRPEAVFSAMETARAGALLEVLENRDAIREASVPKALRDAEDAAKRAAQSVLLRYQKALADGSRRASRKLRRELERARESVRDAVQRIQLAQKSAASVLYPEALTLDEAQEQLGANEAFVLYSLLGDRAAALVLCAGTARIVDLGASAAIEAVAALPLQDTAQDTGGHFERQRRLLVLPLALPANVKHVHVSPDGVLGYVPFAALLPKRSVAFVPSATAYQVLRESRAAPGVGVLALGNPDYAATDKNGRRVIRAGSFPLTPLPGTKAEAEQVGDVVLLGRKATPRAFLAAVRQRERWRAVHVACHGLVDAEHPMQSALALSVDADGSYLLTSADVFEQRIPADVAVLSACNTGRGKIYRSEGIVGLTQAFMLAGAPRVIVSLWKVDDAATRALMTVFYELWNPKSGKGVPPAEALAEAQARVRAQPQWRHPYYWAAWVLWGLAD